MEIASRQTISEAQLKAETLFRTMESHRSQVGDDQLLDRARKVPCENWEPPPSRDQVSEAMALVRSQRAARSSASKTSSIQSSLRAAQSLKSTKRPSSVSLSGIIENDELSIQHPLSPKLSATSGAECNRGILSPSLSHISVQNNGANTSNANDPKKASRINPNASSHASPPTSTKSVSSTKGSFFSNIFASRAYGNELLHRSVASPTADDADDQGRISKDDRNEVETTRDTHVVSNVTSTRAKESPDHDNLVSEIDAYYGCRSDKEEAQDQESKIFAPGSAALQTAGDANGQGGVAKDELNQVETKRGGPVVLNETSRTVKEGPDHESLVSEIDAYYGCGSDEDEVRDLKPEASLAGSVASLTADDAHNPGYIAKDVRNADETMRGTPVVSNTTATRATLSPDHENLVSEIDAYYECLSADNEVPDVESSISVPIEEVSVPVKVRVARAVNFKEIETQDDKPQPRESSFAPAIEAFFDKMFYSVSVGSIFSVGATKDKAKATKNNKENISHVGHETKTSLPSKEVHDTEIDAYYMHTSLNSSDLQDDEQKQDNSDDLNACGQKPNFRESTEEGESLDEKGSLEIISHVDSEPSTFPMHESADLAEVVADYQRASLNSTDLEGDDRIHKNWDSARSDMLKEDASLKANESAENTLPSFSVFEAYSQRNSLDSDQNDDLELLNDMVFDRESLEESYGKHEGRMLKEEMDITLTMTPNSLTLIRNASSLTNGIMIRSHSSGTSIGLQDNAQLHDKKPGDESKGPMFRNDSDAVPTDEDGPGPKMGTTIRTHSSGTSIAVPDDAQLHDETASNDRGDPMLRKVRDAVSINEDGPDPEMGTITRSRSSGTSIEVQDNAQLHDETAGDENRELMLGNISDAVSTDENGPDSTGGIVIRSRSHSSGISSAVDDTLLVHTEIPDYESIDPEMPIFSPMESIDEDDHIISYLERIEASKLDHFEFQSVEVVRITAPATEDWLEENGCAVREYVGPELILSLVEDHPGGSLRDADADDIHGDCSASKADSPHLVAIPKVDSPAFGVGKDCVDKIGETHQCHVSLPETEKIADCIQKSCLDETNDASQQMSVPEADAVAEYMADTHRDISPPEVDAVALDTHLADTHRDISPLEVDAVELDTRHCGNCARSSAFPGLTLDARSKPLKDTMAKTVAKMDYPSLPIHSMSESSSEANSLVFADRDQGNNGCGAIAAAAGCFCDKNDKSSTDDHLTSVRSPDLSLFLPKCDGMIDMVGACAVDSMCMPKRPTMRAIAGNFRAAPIQPASNANMIVNRKPFGKRTAAEVVTTREAAFEEIGDMVMKLLKERDASASSTTPIESHPDFARSAVPIANLLDLDAVAEPTAIADPFQESTPEETSHPDSDLKPANSMDFWDLVKVSLAAPSANTDNPLMNPEATTPVDHPPQVADLLVGDLPLSTEKKNRAAAAAATATTTTTTTTTRTISGIPISIDIPQDDRQISAINSIASGIGNSGGVETNGDNTTTNALQNQITAGLKEIFMNKVDPKASPRTTSKYDAYFEDVGKFVNSLLNGTSMYYDDSALRNVEGAIQSNKEGECDGTNNAPPLTVAVSSNSKDGSVDDAELVNAFIHGY